MSAARTEEPTPKRLREARQRGEVARSRDLDTAAVLLAVAGALAFAHRGMLEHGRAVFEGPLAALRNGGEAAPAGALVQAVWHGAMASAPILIAAVTAGFASSFLQVGPLFALDPVVPRLQRLDLLRALGQQLSQQRLVELVKSLVKVVVVALVGYGVLEDGLRGVVSLAGQDAGAALAATVRLAVELLWRVGGAMALLGVVDAVYQRWRWRRDQRMTKDDVKREHKESEGDPRTKHARQALHRELLTQATLDQVRRADVLVVNPTHIAVALRYDADAEDAVPEIVARGEEDLARRMIDAATEAGVPILRDVPVARALYALSEGDAIPETMYEVVAVILHTAWQERAAADTANEPKEPGHGSAP